MAFKITTSKITGNPGASGWSQVHEFRPDEPEKLNLRGSLFAVLATKSQVAKEGMETVIEGREILLRLHEEYYGTLSGSAFNCLKTAVEKVVQEYLSKGREIEIGAVVQISDVVYSSAGGGAQVAIFRDGMLAKILVSVKGSCVCASGYPQENDVLIIATKAFFKNIPDGIIKAALSRNGLREAAERLAPTIHSFKESADIGLIMIKFEKESLISVLTENKPQVNINDHKFDQPNMRAGIVTKLISLVKKGVSKITRLLPEKKLFVRQSDASIVKTRKTPLITGLILLMILITSIIIGARQKVVKERKSLYESKISQIENTLDESISLYTVDSVKARRLFNDASDMLSGLSIKDFDGDSLKNLKTRLTEKRGEILGEYQQPLESFLDITLLSDGFKGSNLSFSDETIYVLDKDGRKIVSILAGTKKTRLLAGPEILDRPVSLTSYVDRIFVIEDPGGVYEIGKDKKQITDKFWEGTALVKAYAGNLYLLDLNASNIYRFTGTESGFSTKTTWLAPGVKVDLGGTIDFTVDGTVWTLSNEGKLRRFSQGNPQLITPQGVFPETLLPKAIYTDIESKYLYLLDQSGKRIVVLEKDGKYKAQYLADEIGKVIDLVVSEKEQKIYLLTPEKLYTIKIEHRS